VRELPEDGTDVPKHVEVVKDYTDVCHVNLCSYINEYVDEICPPTCSCTKIWFNSLSTEYLVSQIIRSSLVISLHHSVVVSKDVC
jgi:hypothetical protein